MNDDETPVAINLTQHAVWTVASWPTRTLIGSDLLASPERLAATVEGDPDDPEAELTVRFDVFNGGAVYRVRRDLPPFGGALVADLVDGTDRVTARSTAPTGAKIPGEEA